MDLNSVSLDIVPCPNDRRKPDAAGVRAPVALCTTNQNDEGVGVQERFALVLIAMIAGCSGGQKTEAEPVTEESSTETETPSQPVGMERKMLGHWVKASKVRDLVVAGDLEGAKAAAAELGKEVEAPPTAWTTYVTEMKLHTASLADSSSLEEAALAISNVGATCGSCHTDMNTSIEMANSEPPPIGEDARSHMQRHEWSVNATWEGLIGPSDGRWVDGLGVLAEKPLHGREQPSGHVTKDKIELLGETVHDLGVRGTGVPATERAAIFAELIATCGNCHSQQ